MQQPLQLVVLNLEGTTAISHDPNKYKDVFLISIRDTDQPVAYLDIQKNRKNFKRLLPLYFDDIRYPIPGLSMPNEYHVKQVIEETKTENKIIVHCTAGISRSSAIAYVIACSKMSPHKALKYIDPKIHWPNKTIVQLGQEILKKPTMLNILTEHLEKNEEPWGLTPYGKYP